jgi:hypothetical protein
VPAAAAGKVPVVAPSQAARDGAVVTALAGQVPAPAGAEAQVPAVWARAWGPAWAPVPAWAWAPALGLALCPAS